MYNLWEDMRTSSLYLPNSKTCVKEKFNVPAQVSKSTMPPIEAHQNKLESKPTSDKSRKRLNIDLSPEAYELLQQIVDESGKSMAEVLRTGLALYGIAQEERKQGGKLTISDKDNNVKKELVITT